jgi:hypothetical protein
VADLTTFMVAQETHHCRTTALSQPGAPSLCRQAAFASSTAASHPIRITFATCSRARFGRRASDEFAVPLCRVHHRAVHRARDERAWWQVAGIDPIRFARELWNDTRIDEGRM